MNDRLQDTTGFTERSLFTHPVESEDSKSNLAWKIWPKEKKWKPFINYLFIQNWCFKNSSISSHSDSNYSFFFFFPFCNQNHLKNLLTKYFPGIHPKLLSQILGGVLWFFSALRSIKWAGFSSMAELWCSTIKWGFKAPVLSP